jgi:hypothetical protein
VGLRVMFLYSVTDRCDKNPRESNLTTSTAKIHCTVGVQYIDMAGPRLTWV